MRNEAKRDTAELVMNFNVQVFLMSLRYTHSIRPLCYSTSIQETKEGCVYSLDVIYVTDMHVWKRYIKVNYVSPQMVLHLRD